LSDEPEADELPTTEDAGAERENQEPPCAECAACYAQKDQVSAGLRSWDDIPELTSLDEIDRFPGLLFSTTGQHIADLDNLRAFYNLTDRPVRCSLQGAHRHGFGVVVTMLCGQTLRMGKVCGKKSIINFNEVFADVARRRKFQSDKRFLEGWPERYHARLSALRHPLELRYGWLATLRHHLPDLFLELRRRRAQGARGTEVTVKTGRPIRSDLPQELRDGASAELIQNLRGLALLDSDPPSLERLEASLTKYRTEANRGPIVDGATAQVLARIAGKADARATAAGEWIRETADFVAIDNLWLALAALDQPSGLVEPSDDGPRVSYPGAAATFSAK
jgi:hypothetical protein